MAQLSDTLADFLKEAQGKEVTLNYLRHELRIQPGTPEWNGLRVLMLRLAKKNVVKPSGRKDGVFRVIKQVNPGNEYTKLVNDIYVPDQRFLNRLRDIDGIEWLDEEGNDKLTLLPVMGDYAEHIVPDRLNIIDWINLDANQLYGISKVMEDIKANLGKGVAVVALQKSAGADAGRGGQFTKDFTDCELLLDGWDNTDDTLLTIGTIKEKTKPIMGKTYIFSHWNGARIINFREVRKCPKCFTRGYTKMGPCDNCYKTGFVNKDD